MKILLDTHTFLWFCLGDEHLSTAAKSMMEDDSNLLFLSIVSVWEMAIKVSLGKLEFEQSFDKTLPHLLWQNGINVLPIDLEHIYCSAQLPFYHRDPFDRLLIAQAIQEQIPIISVDSVFDSYPVKRLW